MRARDVRMFNHECALIALQKIAIATVKTAINLKKKKRDRFKQNMLSQFSMLQLFNKDYHFFSPVRLERYFTCLWKYKLYESED